MPDKNFPVLNFQDFIAADGEKLTTDSLKVAAVFGKSHAHVLRDIDRIITQVPDSFGETNFGCSEYEHQNNLGFKVNDRMFKMTRDGFSLVVMGFTGKKALAYKIAFIEAFNQMAEFIKNQRNGLMYRHFELQLEHKQKKEKASICGRGLNEWKGEKPVLEAAMASIDEKMQPQLSLVAA